MSKIHSVKFIKKKKRQKDLPAVSLIYMIFGSEHRLISFIFFFSIKKALMSSWCVQFAEFLCGEGTGPLVKYMDMFAHLAGQS